MVQYRAKHHICNPALLEAYFLNNVSWIPLEGHSSSTGEWIVWQSAIVHKETSNKILGPEKLNVT